MKNLLEITPNKELRITPAMLAIKEFKALWNGDSPIEELSYVYFFADWQSPYRSKPEKTRTNIVRDDVITKENWNPDDRIKKAIKKYEELQEETTSIALLKEVEKNIFRIREYLQSINLNAPPNDKRDPASDMIKNMKELLALDEDVAARKAKIEEEMKKAAVVKGNTTIKKRERI